MQGPLVAGRYRLADIIGSGGMGRVWRAHDEVLHRAVAIKELTAALYVSESDQERLLARTRAEARAAARINHSAVVTVHDVLDHDGRPWLVMELVEGRSLADAVKDDGRMEPAEAARIGLWVLRALRAAHAAGVLHRDIKPGNVLLARDGRVLLTDFGIAQIEGDNTITRTGEVVGSVDYLAPERIRGHDPGPASDLWALGATLYTAVEGRSPFRRTSPLSTMQAVVEEDAAAAHHAGPLGPVITALLRKDPAERPDSAAAERMLAEAAEGRQPREAQGYVPTGHAVPPTATFPPGAAAFPQTAGTVHPTGTTGTPYVPDTRAHTMSTTPGAPPPERSRRPRLRTLTLVVVLAALVGGGTAVGIMAWDQDRRQGGDTRASVSPTASPSPTSSATGSPSPDPSASEGNQGPLPDGWVRKEDPRGFSLALPGPEWQRVEVDALQVDYTPDGGRTFIRIAVDASPDFSSAYEHQLDLEEQLQRLVAYQRVTLEENVYRDRPGALWEWTWTALAKDTPFPGPRHAIEQIYFGRDGTEYAIYMSSAEEDWATTREWFTSVLQGWRPGVS
ncbi:serine/threonine-protein kinase [Streptomyces sp. B93]|uniref:serine/threonine-protein kinase n=1 Tax=Streptomyces sp. B93 TaxID=2824875 RepID=UPI001B38BC90|nr:serine/threonine-protein kinase [Streptomyces sp. B93]MBQ1090153.1 protein kinase [Streptomyces sp. B93]